MSIRKITYTVGVDGISPMVKQDGGMQGDHKVTEIVFEITSELYDALESGQYGELKYRVRGYDGEGGHADTVPEILNHAKITYLLEEWMTRYGGIVKAVLIITALKDDKTEIELFNFPATLQLKNLPMGKNVEGKNFDSPITFEKMIMDAVDAANSVRKDADNGLFKGDKGDKGDTGPKGPQGERGEQGIQGVQGVQGPKGDKGDKGDTYNLTEHDRMIIGLNVLESEIIPSINNDLEDILSLQNELLGGETE